MSGPKSYSPPPQFSARIFDGALAEIFQLHSKLIDRIAFLNGLKVDDADRNISFDCKAGLKTIQSDIDKVSRPFEFDCPNSFGSRERNFFQKQLDNHLSIQQKTINALDQILRSFNDSKADYDSFVAIEELSRRYSQSLESLKSSLIGYLEKHLSDDQTGKAQAKSKIEAITWSNERIAFGQGFRNLESERRIALEENFSILHDQANDIRQSVATELRSNRGKVSAAGKLPDKEVPDSIRSDSWAAEYATRLRTSILEIEEPEQVTGYLQRLDRLVTRGDEPDSFYFDQLWEEIRQVKQTTSCKKEILEMMIAADKVERHSSLLKKFERLVEEGYRLRSQNKVLSHEFEQFCARWKETQSRNQVLLAKEQGRRSETEFLRAHIAQGLTRLGYRVISESVVIDLNGEQSVVCSAPNGETFVNLLFHQDGSFDYKCMSAEDPATMSRDKRHEAVVRMQKTCDDFKVVVKELGSLGVELNLLSEEPACEDTLLHAPEALRKAVEMPSLERRSKVSKRRYIDRKDSE